VLRPQGYATIDDPDTRKVEYDTAMCGHCQLHLHVKPGSGCTVYLFPQADGRVIEQMGAFCRVCMSPVCLSCDEVGNCIPWERSLELVESKRSTIRSVEEALGRSLS